MPRQTLKAMKVRTRTVPNDTLSFKHKDYAVSIATHHQQVTVTIELRGENVMNDWLTPEQFISLLLGVDCEAFVRTMEGEVTRIRRHEQRRPIPHQ